MNFVLDCPATPDEGVGVMSAGLACGGEIDFEAEAGLVGIEHQRSDVIADVEQESVGAALSRAGVVKGLLTARGRRQAEAPGSLVGHVVAVGAGVVVGLS